MEASPLPTSDTENWAEQFDRSLSLQGDRVRDFLDAQQQRLERVEVELAEQLDQVAGELAQDRTETDQAREEIQQHREQLARETKALEGLKEELADRQAEWEQLQQRAGRQQEALAEQIRRQQEELDRRHEELAKRQPELDAAEAKLHHDQRALDLARQEHQAELEQLAATRERLEAKQAELDNQREQLAARQANTETRRRHIAREFKAQHAAHLKELERRRAELQRRDASEQAELKRQLEITQRQETELAAELKTAQQRGQELAAELESLRGRCDQLERELARPPADGGADAEELKSAETQRDALLARLTETESRLAEAEQRLAGAPDGGTDGGTDGEPADGDAQRRYEMAMEDLHELKAQNAELRERLAQARSATSEVQAAGEGLDWEAEKQRILARLESDSDEDDEEAKAERLKIEEAIQTTDRVLAEKDQEIDELKQLLENQSGSLGSLAVGAAALGEMLDSDAVVQEERENLKHLQEEWREKLRQAEIDISVERAKIARDRAEIEGKLRALQNQGAEAAKEDDDSAESDKPPRGRWLARLGLKDPEEQ